MSFVMSVCPSAWTNSAPTGRIFMRFDTWGFSESLSWKVKFHLNLTRISGTLREDQYTFLIISRSVLLRVRNISDKRRENQNTHFMFSNFFSRKSCRLWDNVGKYCRARQATDDKMANAHYMLDNYVYRHTLRVCNTDYFSSTTTAERTRLHVTLYVASCLVSFVDTSWDGVAPCPRYPDQPFEEWHSINYFVTGKPTGFNPQ